MEGELFAEHADFKRYILSNTYLYACICIASSQGSFTSCSVRSSIDEQLQSRFPVNPGRLLPVV